MRQHQRAIVALAVVWHAVLMIGVLLDCGPGRNTDFDRFWEIASTPGRPYVDYPVERAPGEVVALKAIATLAPDRSSFGWTIVLVNAVADVTIGLALAWGWGLEAVSYYLFCAIPLVVLLFGRIDLWSIAAATVGVAAWRRRLRVPSAIAIGIGAAFKAWPILLAPLLWTRISGRRVVVTLTIAAVGACAAVWITTLGRAAIDQVLTFRGATGWQVESVVGSVVELVGSPPRFESGAYRAGTIAPWASVALFALAAPVAAWAAWTGARRDRVGTAWTAAVGVLLLFSALFSAQFAGWLIPAGAIAFVEGDRRSAAGIGVIVLLTEAIYKFYGAIVDGALVAVLVVIVRNFLLFATVLGAIRLIASRPQGRVAEVSPAAAAS
jgi:hypothetical protein